MDEVKNDGAMVAPDKHASGVQLRAALNTPAVNKAADRLAKRILAKEASPYEFAVEVKKACDAANLTVGSARMVKNIVREKLEDRNCPRSIAKTTAERNRWDYFYRTACQYTAEMLAVPEAAKGEDIFSVFGFLEGVLKKLSENGAPPPVIEEVRKALALSAPVADKGGAAE